MQLQAMQGASLVGRDVIVAGNKLSVDATAGIGQGGFELANAADAVKVEILSPSGARRCRRSTSAPRAPACTASTGRSGSATSASGLTLSRQRDHRRRRDDGDAADARPRRRDQHRRQRPSTSSSRARDGALQRRSRPSTRSLPAAATATSTESEHAMGFQQGLSGLNASSKSLEVIGNNIANANTVGAKAARAEFADVYAERARRRQLT